MAALPAEVHYLPNLHANAASLYYVKSTASSISGAAAGVLGLTNLSGFAFYILSSLAVGAYFSAVNCHAKPAGYFAHGARETVLSGLLDNLFAFVLFWTLLYALCHIYH